MPFSCSASSIWKIVLTVKEKEESYLLRYFLATFFDLGLMHLKFDYQSINSLNFRNYCFF